MIVETGTTVYHHLSRYAWVDSSYECPVSYCKELDSMIYVYIAVSVWPFSFCRWGVKTQCLQTEVIQITSELLTHLQSLNSVGRP